MSAATTSRTYPRNTVEWDIQDLCAMEEAGRAVYYSESGMWVVKTDNGSFAVRPHQVHDYEGEAMIAIEQAYERYLEDGGPHAAAIQAEEDEERRRYGY